MSDQNPAESLSLYMDDLCGYCARVRSVIDELGVNVEMRNIGNREHAKELIEARGRATVPVLRRVSADGESTDLEWMPESSDIIDYLRNTYGAS